MEEMEDSDEKQPGILMFVAAVSALLMKFFGKQIPLAFVYCIIFRHNDSLSKIFGAWFLFSGIFFWIFFGITGTIVMPKH